MREPYPVRNVGQLSSAIPLAVIFKCVEVFSVPCIGLQVFHQRFQGGDSVYGYTVLTVDFPGGRC